MHAHERQLCDQLDKLDEELHASQQQTAEVEAERQVLLDEFQQLQVQVGRRQTEVEVGTKQVWGVVYLSCRGSMTFLPADLGVHTCWMCMPSCPQMQRVNPICTMVETCVVPSF